MSRKLIALDIALAVLVVAAGWRLWDEMSRGEERQEAVIGQPLEPAQLPAESSVPPPEPLQAADYATVAQRVLFFRDRNPDVVIEVAAPKPLPPMPVAHGVLDIGSGPTVILSDTATGAQQGYRIGDTFGEFKIVQITNDRLLLDWDGERISRTIAELKPDESEVAPPTRAAAPKPKPAKAQNGVIGKAEKAGPSDVDLGSGIKACKAGDTSPPGTVSGGYKKVVTETPFGKVCRWEPSQ